MTGNYANEGGYRCTCGRTGCTAMCPKYRGIPMGSFIKENRPKLADKGKKAGNSYNCFINSRINAKGKK